MESMAPNSFDPAADPAADLDAADAARTRLTSSLRLPPGFHALLAFATAVQIGTAAFGLSEGGGPRLWALLAGLAFFSAVCALLLRSFRRLNGVRVEGLFRRASMGTSTRSSLADLAGFAAAFWAALEGQWVAGRCRRGRRRDPAYALSARLWWRDYLADPTAHARGGESRLVVVLIGLVGLAGLLALVLLR